MRTAAPAFCGCGHDQSDQSIGQQHRQATEPIRQRLGNAHGGVTRQRREYMPRAVLVLKEADRDVATWDFSVNSHTAPARLTSKETDAKRDCPVRCQPTFDGIAQGLPRHVHNTLLLTVGCIEYLHHRATSSKGRATSPRDVFRTLEGNIGLRPDIDGMQLAKIVIRACSPASCGRPSRTYVRLEKIRAKPALGIACRFSHTDSNTDDRAFTLPRATSTVSSLKPKTGRSMHE